MTATVNSLFASLRIVIATMLICVAGYAAIVWLVGRAVPYTADGWLITAPDGTVIGSHQIAQEFTSPGYFWPRPSAVGYNGAGAGGSNKSPTSLALTERAIEIVARYGATADNPLPAELAAASGGGLDPHITEAGALFQAARVAEARGLDLAEVENLVREHAFSPGGFLAPDRLVNVLELNLALDALAAGAL
jgi:K+-transporting ATPase ATPase C chain